MEFLNLSYIDSILVKGGVVIGAITSFLFGTWQEYLTILIVMQAIDLVTGFFNAKNKYELSSSQMYKGLMKKFAVWLVVIIAHMIDLILFDNHVVQAAVAFGYIANEALSAVENLGEMGILVPESVVKYLNQIKDKSEDPQQ